MENNRIQQYTARRHSVYKVLTYFAHETSHFVNGDKQLVIYSNNANLIQ